MQFRIGRRAGLAVTAGLAGMASLLVMSSPASAYVGAPYIRYGATGNPAYCVQVGIDSMDNSNIYTYPDGHFGPDTLRALKAFQSYWGLQPDGVVGPATGSKLMEMIYMDGATTPNNNIWCNGYLPTYS